MRAIILLVGSLAIVVAQQGGEAAAKAAASPLDATSIGAQLTQFLETEYFLPLVFGALALLLLDGVDRVAVTAVVVFSIVRLYVWLDVRFTTVVWTLYVQSVAMPLLYLVWYTRGEPPTVAQAAKLRGERAAARSGGERSRDRSCSPARGLKKTRA